MRMIDLIAKKRDGKTLTAEEFDFIAQGAAKGTVPDYQLSAFLMACFLRPLSDKETALFTKAMAHSGGRLDFSDVKLPKTDKHSTGGVGDGISLALAPLVACAGVAVPMMSGRGLGHTGGTLDKLESMKNFEVRVPVKSIHRQMQKLGVCMFGQTQDLAPADKKLYSLRDASSTVESRPLIVASILSKKYAEGVDSLLMDVKYGSGAFMKKLEDSRKLARALVATAKLLGLKCRALITYMDQPLGRAIGNGNEMLQTVRILKGEKDLAPDFYELLLEQAANMLVISGKQKDIKKARKILEEKIANGEALAKLRELVKWQGGDTQAVDNPEKYFKPAFTKEGFNRHFAEVVKTMYTNIDFKGRTSRSQYWYFSLYYLILAIAAGILDGILFGGILGMLLSLGLLLPSLELTVRRIHDLGKPWFWLLISLVPFIGGIALLIWFCMPGETKANQWGEPVK